MSLIENLKAELTQTIQLEIQKRLKNCDLSIYDRRLYLLEQQVHNFTELIEKEQLELRSERSDLFSKIKESQLFLEAELKRIDQEIKK